VVVLSPEDQARLNRVIAAVDVVEPHHQKWCKRAGHYYSLYRNCQDWRRTYETTNDPRGRDSIYRDGQKEFGPELFIPLCFRAVETIVPRMLAGRPRMAVLPRNEASEANVRTLSALIDAQQEQIDYELKLQTIAKDGLIYGLGVQKCQWDTRYKTRTQVMQIPVPGGGGQTVEKPVVTVVFDDPNAYAIDPFDFLADPFCGDISEAEFAIHRTWRTNSFLSTMVRAGRWRNLDTIANLDGLVDARKYDEIWADRLRAGGRAPSDSVGVTGSGRVPLHEVLEFHDGDQVITVLDRKIVVQSGSNPHWHGELPFQCYRPTQVTHELYGIGEIEPIEQLQEEMNTLRTQRRYNADLVLQRVFAYHEGMVDAGDIKFGPGVGIPVNGDPRELLFPVPVGDIPYSSYQEEDRISADIDSTTGVSDTLAGGEISGETATSAQLGYSAASARIRNKLLRLELEIVTPGTRQFVSLDQQKIRQAGTRPPVREETLPMPGEPDRRWNWLEVGPEQIAGEFDVRCESLSSEPDNVPQERSDAEQLWTMFNGAQTVDQRWLAAAVISKMGFKQPEAHLAPPQPQVPPETLDILAQAGVPREIIAQALALAGGPDLTAAQPQLEGSGANSQEGPRGELPAAAQPAGAAR
jgi:hypothetical protein